MLTPSLQKNDAKAKWLIGIFSVIVFAVVTVLGRYNLADKNIDLGFDLHIFALINAVINGTVALLLVVALYFVKQQNFVWHKKLMMTAMILSVLFLVSYICHHLLAGETMYGETDGVAGLSEAEKAAAGGRTIYLLILLTHIPLAGLALPFILFSAYRALTGEYEKHKKLVRIVWPVWFYVAVTGVIVYLMINPYYH